MGRLQANYNASKNNRISIQKQNLGNGRNLLYKFNPKSIPNLACWLDNSPLETLVNLFPRIIFLSFAGSYNIGQLESVSGFDFDYHYYESEGVYYGADYGWYILQDGYNGVWYLFDPDGNSWAENRYGVSPWSSYLWTAYDDFELNLDDWGVTPNTSESYLARYRWNDKSGPFGRALRMQESTYNGEIILNSPFNSVYKQVVGEIENFSLGNKHSIFFTFNKGTNNGLSHLNVFGSKFYPYVFSIRDSGTAFEYRYTVAGSNIFTTSRNRGTSLDKTNKGTALGFVYNTENTNNLSKNIRLYSTTTLPASVNQSVDFQTSSNIINFGELYFGSDYFLLNNSALCRFGEILIFDRGLSDIESRAVLAYLERNFRISG